MGDPRQYAAFIHERLRSPNRAAALPWLEADPNRTIWEHGNAESVAIVRHLLALGAAEVIAVETEGDCCCELIVELPDDRRSRNNLLGWGNEQAERRGFDRDEDFGQEYMFVFFT
jgi:hypothetical protein